MPYGGAIINESLAQFTQTSRTHLITSDGCELMYCLIFNHLRAIPWLWPTLFISNASFLLPGNTMNSAVWKVLNRPIYIYIFLFQFNSWYCRKSGGSCHAFKRDKWGVAQWTLQSVPKFIYPRYCPQIANICHMRYLHYYDEQTNFYGCQ